MICKFRKKPVVIEAWQFTVIDANNPTAIEWWCGGKVRGMTLYPQDRVIQIQTLEGEIEGSVGDWIIKGVKGEFYPCKPDIFKMTYEEVT
jgi:hypothetical protein